MFDLDQLDCHDCMPDAIAAVLALDVPDVLFTAWVNDRAMLMAGIPADEAPDRFVHQD